MKILWIFVLSLAHTTYAGQVPLENTIPSLADTTYSRLSPEENINLQQTCGEKHPLFKRPLYKMLHGTEVLPNEFPFMAATNEFKKRQWRGIELWVDRDSYCSAVLISKRHVLTAAHCVLIDARGHEARCYQGYKRPEEYMEPEKLEVYIGTRCPKWGPCTPNRTVYEATSVIPHPYFKICGAINDIAIVELSKDVDENDGIPICMPKENEQLATTLLAVGYGQDRFAVRPGLQVTEFYRSYVDPKEPSQIVSVDAVHSLCPGDSGGPLFHEKDGKYTLLGIASHIRPNCTVYAVERESHHTDVRKFLTWICMETGVCPAAGDDYPDDDY